MRNGLEIDIFDNKYWYKNDKFHREDGPAVELNGGCKYWYLNNKLHRVDGPAIEYIGGKVVWFYEDEKINCSSQKEFLQIIKLKAFW